VRDDIRLSDKPWLAVDDWPGTGQHDVYVTCTGWDTTASTQGLWLAVSRDGVGENWTNPPVLLRQVDRPDVSGVNSPIIQMGPDHLAYAFWFESSGPWPYYTNWLKTR
jgi:hypothetical protein